jgi:hypothetical protein
MSVTYDESPKYWEAYLMYCHINKLVPRLSDYKVWLDEQDIDEDEEWDMEVADVA